jgi:hypothetical protein
MLEHKKLKRYSKHGSWELISHEDFLSVFTEKLNGIDKQYKAVTGPGRSGAIVAVYTSHYLHIPFVPHKAMNDFVNLSPLLIIDTVEYTGSTLRKAKSWYEKRGVDADTLFLLKEKRGMYYKFWYECLGDQNV